MSFFCALFLWVIIAAALVTGVAMASYGHWWVLGVGAFLFIASLIKEGIMTH